MSSDSGFSIQFVSKVTGINPHTIRAWEKRYDVVTPMRTSNLRRVYSQDNINRLKMVNELVQMGSNISDVASLSDNDLLGMFNTFAVRVKKQKTTNISTQERDMSLGLIEVAISGYNLELLMHEFNKLKKSLAPREFVEKLSMLAVRELYKLKKESKMDENKFAVLSSFFKTNFEQYLYSRLPDSFNQEKAKVLFISSPSGISNLKFISGAILCLEYALDFDFVSIDLTEKNILEALKASHAKYVFIGEPVQDKAINFYSETIASSFDGQRLFWQDCLFGESSLPSDMHIKDISDIDSIIARIK